MLILLVFDVSFLAFLAFDATQHAVVHLDRARRAHGVVAQRGLALRALGLDLAVEALRAAVRSLALGLRGETRSARRGRARIGKREAPGTARVTIGRRTSAVPTHVASSRHVATRRAADRPVAIARGIPPRVRACVAARWDGRTVIIMNVPAERFPLLRRVFFSRNVSRKSAFRRSSGQCSTRARGRHARRAAHPSARALRASDARARKPRAAAEGDTLRSRLDKAVQVGI